MSGSRPGRGEHHLGRFTTRDQHGQAPQRRLVVREFVLCLFPTLTLGIDPLVVYGSSAVHPGAVAACWSRV